MSRRHAMPGGFAGCGCCRYSRGPRRIQTRWAVAKTLRERNAGRSRRGDRPSDCGIRRRCGCRRLLRSPALSGGRGLPRASPLKTWRSSTRRFAVRGTLPADLQAQAGLVWEALELLAGGHGDPAVDQLSSIGRSSPFSEWRLFVRGLAAFQEGDLARARDAWSRLDASRRPARIAKLLGEAWEAVQGGEPTTAVTGGGTATGSPAAAARTLLARASMWEAAERVASVRHRNPDQTFSASQVATTVRLVKQYGSPIQTGWHSLRERRERRAVASGPRSSSSERHRSPTRNGSPRITST